MSEDAIDAICSSCKRKIANQSGAVSFNCPNCKKEVIARCVSCRKTAATYRCHSCGFEGPN